MKIVMVPMHDDLAMMGVCSSCFRDFGDDKFYCQVSRSRAANRTEVWIACIGCAALLACNE